MLAGCLFDIVPDIVPVAGQLDDVVIAALLSRSFLRLGGEPCSENTGPGA